MKLIKSQDEIDKKIKEQMYRYAEDFFEKEFIKIKKERRLKYEFIFKLYPNLEEDYILCIDFYNQKEGYKHFDKLKRLITKFIDLVNKIKEIINLYSR